MEAPTYVMSDMQVVDRKKIHTAAFSKKLLFPFFEVPTNQSSSAEVLQMQRCTKDDGNTSKQDREKKILLSVQTKMRRKRKETSQLKRP
jgi:hypothetical protein